MRLRGIFFALLYILVVDYAILIYEKYILGVAMNEQETKELLNDILKSLFHKILKIQVKSVSKATGGNLSRTEMHLLECIEDNPDIILTDIAEKLGITKATASVSVGTLVKKGYMKKDKLPSDKRKSKFQLTETGVASCQKHRKFHDSMVKSVLNEFKIEEYPEVLKSLQALLHFFEMLDS